MITETRQFGNHKFIITTGMQDTSGVVIHPDTANLDSLDFIKDLQWALTAFPFIEAYNYVFELYKSPPGDLCDYPERMLDSVLENWNKFSRSNFLANHEKGVVVGYVCSVEKELKDRQQRRDNKLRPRSKNQTPASSGRSGFVYLVQSSTGAYKIGRTVNPKDRLRTFNVKLPFEVEYVVTIQTSNMGQLESELHNRFAAKRVNGEWFNLTPADVEYIKGLAS